MGEVYKRNGEWKFKSIGQGFAAGLAKMSESFGLTVAEDAQAVPGSAVGGAPIPAAAARSAAPSAVFEPSHKGFGEVTVTLNWAAVPVTSDQPKGGLLGGCVVTVHAVQAFIGQGQCHAAQGLFVEAVSLDLLNH